ncbi:hypothetical protein GOODEAATRI_002832 [Goodea atripinnis]|uniref:Uncharacterized protein n=1 Tax=Goodea atripinnis TaxID=208336 RepID=A0ABV0PAX9_9TELE
MVADGGFCDVELVRSFCSKASVNHDTSISPPYFTVGLRFFSWTAVLVFCKTCPLFWCPFNSVLNLCVQRTYFQSEVLVLVSVLSPKLQSDLHVLLKEPMFAFSTLQSAFRVNLFGRPNLDILAVLYL